MLKQLRGGAAAALVFVACAATMASFARADAKEDIKSSAQSFAKALQAGDAAEAHKYAITNDQSSKLLDTMAHLTKAHKKMTDAAVAKFGDEGKTLMGGPNPAMRGPEQIAKDMNDADIQINGDTATITPKAGQPGQPGQSVTFKKEKGVWKIDFTQFPNQERMQQGLPMMEKMSTVMSETGDDITAGKYKSVQEARMGFIQKMRAVIGAGGPAGGPPGGPGGQR
jgi:hypothetical protein